jgi:hypothetical protein
MNVHGPVKIAFWNRKFFGASFENFLEKFNKRAGLIAQYRPRDGVEITDLIDRANSRAAPVNPPSDCGAAPTCHRIVCFRASTLMFSSFTIEIVCDAPMNSFRTRLFSAKLTPVTTSRNNDNQTGRRFASLACFGARE